MIKYLSFFHRQPVLVIALVAPLSNYLTFKINLVFCCEASFIADLSDRYATKFQQVVAFCLTKRKIFPALWAPNFISTTAALLLSQKFK